MRSFIAGLLGGILIISLFILILFKFNLYNYNIKIINPKKIDQYEYKYTKSAILKQLEEDGILLTPQEYTSNLIEYYNTALSILAGLLIVFSVVSYFHLRFLSRSQINEILKENLRDSKEFETIINDTIFGKAEDKFINYEQYDQLLQRLDDVEQRLIELQNND